MNDSFAHDPDGSDTRRQLAKEAHKLISMAGTFGFLSLAESCAALEAAALDDGADLTAVLDDVRTKCQRALAEITTRLARPQDLQQSA